MRTRRRMRKSRVRYLYSMGGGGSIIWLFQEVEFSNPKKRGVVEEREEDQVRSLVLCMFFCCFPLSCFALEGLLLFLGRVFFQPLYGPWNRFFFTFFFSHIA